VACRRLPAGEKVRVWSMNVHKHHTYVTTSGIVTGNSIHSFAGGDYTHFMSWEATESTMQRSYRCPRQVLALGEACLRQMTKGYRDRKIQHAGHDGSVSRVGSAEEALSRLSANTSALILGRCAYSLEEYEAILQAKGMPYLWIDKTSGSSTLSGYAALWGLQHGRTISGDDWANAVQAIAVKSGEHGELLTRGTKTAWKSGKMSHVDLIRPTPDDYELIGVTPSLASLISQGRWHLAIEPKSADRARIWLDTATRYGEEVATNPPIRLSTIHGAKGLEADTVILSSITSPSVERSRNALSDLHDEECRVAYVAVTRARQDFMFVDDGYRYRMELPL
jgi:UvrD-like helicase C-terminal domain